MRLKSKKDEHWLSDRGEHISCIERKWECCEYVFVRYQHPCATERLEVHDVTPAQTDCVFHPFDPNHFHCCPCCGKGIPDIQFEAKLGDTVNE